MKSDKAEEGNGVRGTHWSQLREAGSMAGFRIMLWVYRVFGKRLFTILMYPVMLYFILRRRVSREASRDYLATHYAFAPEQWSHEPGFRDVLNHFMAFGDSVLDKLMAWSTLPDRSEFDLPDQNAIDEFHNDPRGHLIIGSHFGNLEFCRGYMQRTHPRNINILVHERHSANFVEMMRQINPLSRFSVFQVDSLDIGTILELKNRIDNGEWLFIAGDRIPLSGFFRTTRVSFLGRNAWMPIGPYLLAKSLGCPVILMFAYRFKGKIRLEIDKLCDQLVLDRRHRDRDLAAYTQTFATALEKRCRIAPFQWFNFYLFWNEHHADRSGNQTKEDVMVKMPVSDTTDQSNLS